MKAFDKSKIFAVN